MRVELGFFLFSLLMIISRFLRIDRARSKIFLVTHLLVVWLVFLQGSIAGACLLLLAVPFHYLLLIKKAPEFLQYVWPVLILTFLKTFPTYVVIGFSFLCFRMLSATLEMRAGKVSDATLASYLNYCFFFPTYKLGPIGTFKDHLESESIQANLRWNDLNWEQLLRVLWGAGKYLFISAYFRNFTNSFGVGEWSDADSILKIILIGFSSYIFVYLSFSGFIDIAVGISHFLGFKMKENFEHPFRARNVSEFWANWHISLTDLLKELVFYPLNLHLLRAAGRDKKLIVTPIVLILLFLSIGIWHGVGWNFICLGLYHATGAITAYYFGELMSWLWPDYAKSKMVNLISIMFTQVFIATSFLFFDNSLEEILKIWSRI